MINSKQIQINYTRNKVANLTDCTLLSRKRTDVFFYSYVSIAFSCEVEL